MRCLPIALLVAAIACGNDSTDPRPVDGGAYDLTSTSDGPPPVMINRLTDPANGNTRTDSLIADRITFVRGTGQVLRDLTSSQTLGTPGSPAQTFSGTIRNYGDWLQSRDKVVISWHLGYPGMQSTVVDTLRLVHGELHGRIVRQVCADCAPGTPLDLVYVRGAS